MANSVNSRKQGRSASRRPSQPTVRLAKIGELTADPANANKGTDRGRELLPASIRDHGFGRSVLADKHGVLIAGNKTQEAAIALGLDDAIVVPTDGTRLVVVQRTDLDLAKDPKAAALALADNRVAELNLEWDPAVLQALADRGVPLKDLWSDRELVSFFARVDPGLTDPDEVPDERATSIVVGDLFELGHHRLLCGDSTNESDVDRVVGRDRPVLMNTDPPYGIDYAALKDGIPRSGFRNIQARGGDIVNDDLTDGAALQAFLERMIRAAVPRLSPAPAFYLWHPMLTQGTFFAAAAAADILIHRQVIWVKPHMVLTRSGQYHWRHELAFYGWVRGKPCPWYGNKSQTSVWEMGESTRGREHPTQKPVELFIRPIQNHTLEGECVYEPFAGSGSQVIAAEQTKRRCLAIEIEPRYCQVIVDRWEAFTGKKSKRVGAAKRR